MYEKLLSFINKFKLCSDCHFGFQKHRSTELAIIHALDYIINALNSNTPVVGLFVDISKAFDSINHRILLDKLHHLGFRDIIHSWLSSYLYNRLQYVEIIRVKSDYQKIVCGVLQGSIFGPLVFIFYIINIKYISKQLHFI